MVRQGWAEARTIFIGALVFVSAFLWRDLIKYGVDAIKETRMAKIPGWVANLGMAILLTLITVIILLLSKPSEDKSDESAATTSTRLRQMF